MAGRSRSTSRSRSAARGCCLRATRRPTPRRRAPTFTSSAGCTPTYSGRPRSAREGPTPATSCARRSPSRPAPPTTAHPTTPPPLAPPPPTRTIGRTPPAQVAWGASSAKFAMRHVAPLVGSAAAALAPPASRPRLLPAASDCDEAEEPVEPAAPSSSPALESGADWRLCCYTLTARARCVGAAAGAGARGVGGGRRLSGSEAVRHTPLLGPCRSRLGACP